MDKKRIGREERLIGDVLHRQGGRVRDGAADNPKADGIKPGIGLCDQIGEEQDGFGDLEVVLWMKVKVPVVSKMRVRVMPVEAGVSPAMRG
jgi:hypothetical protein